MPPVRLCCGKRHYGPICPDGRVMCCVCYNRVTQDELAVEDDGFKVDVCKDCYKKEQDEKEADRGTASGQEQGPGSDHPTVQRSQDEKQD